MRGFREAVLLLPSAAVGMALLAVSVLVLDDFLTPHKPAAAIAYLKTSYLALVLPLALYMIRFVHHIFTLHQQPQEGDTFVFQRFLYPVIEDVVRGLFLVVVASFGRLDFVEVTFMTVYSNLFVVAAAVMLVVPSFYRQRYRGFGQLYTLWQNHVTFKSQDDDEAERLLECIVTGRPDKRQSLVSFDSDETVFPAGVCGFPPTFKVGELLKEGAEVAPPQVSLSSSPTAPMAVLLSNKPSCNTLNSTSSKVYSDMLDRLYSVSPKNTYHLNTATAMAALEPHYIDQDHDSRNGDEASISSHDGFNRGFPGFQGGLCKSQSINSQNNQSLRTQASTTFGPGHGQSKKETYSLLKKKLSTYSISYGSIDEDLESQQQDSDNHTHAYHDFRHFMYYHYDYSLDANKQAITIDPMFVKYGTVMPETAAWIVVGDWVNALVWTFASFWMYSIAVVSLSSKRYSTCLALGGAAVTMAIKVAKRNWVDGRRPRSIVLGEAAANVAVVGIFIAVIFATR